MWGSQGRKKEEWGGGGEREEKSAGGIHEIPVYFSVCVWMFCGMISPPSSSLPQASGSGGGCGRSIIEDKHRKAKLNLDPSYLLPYHTISYKKHQLQKPSANREGK